MKVGPDFKKILLRKSTMESSCELLSLILDSLTEHIVVINEAGEIQYVNKSWSIFGNNNACVVGEDWAGVNYIDECEKASAMGDDFGEKAGNGIRSVVEKNEQEFYFEYPCHSPDEKRWFMMRVTPFQLGRKSYFVISHQNITERRLAEEEVRNLAKIDGLTGIPNRRAFDEFLHNEWKRCARIRKPLSLAMVDLDHFKSLNDTYGHQFGDDCLIRIGTLLERFSNRPSDLCARYGGEEFALVWGDTSLEQARRLSKRMLEEIISLGITNYNAPAKDCLTASIGLAVIVPGKDSEEIELISKADRMLYKAKKNGRNKVESIESTHDKAFNADT